MKGLIIFKASFWSGMNYFIKTFSGATINIIADMIIKAMAFESQPTEAATRGVLWKNVFLEISQSSQESTCARVSFLITLQAWGLQLY